MAYRDSCYNWTFGVENPLPVRCVPVTLLRHYLLQFELLTSVFRSCDLDVWGMMPLPGVLLFLLSGHVGYDAHSQMDTVGAEDCCLDIRV